MSSAPPIDLSAIPEDQRDAVLAVLRERDVLREVNKRLEHLVAELNQAVHGKRSEKLSEDERQLAFEDLETAVAEAKTQQDAQAATGPAPRKAARRNRGNLPKDLPRIERVIEPDSLDCPCGCGEMHRIGEDRTERLDIIPAQLRVIVTVRPKYACRACAEGVTQAPAPAHLIEGGLPTEGAIAHVLVSKFSDHLPLYRQSQILARSGIDIHRSTLADWVGTAAFHLDPVVDRLAEHLKGSGKLFMDETTAPVLDPGRGRTKTGYLWALARDDRGWGGDDPPGVVFTFAPGRAGQNAEQILQGFDGILQLDGYTGYNRLTRPSRKGGAPVTVAHCWAHLWMPPLLQGFSVLSHAPRLRSSIRPVMAMRPAPPALMVNPRVGSQSRSASSELDAPSGFSRPRSARSCHLVQKVPRICGGLPTAVSNPRLVSSSSRLAHRSAVDTAKLHHRPDHAGRLVGNGDRRDIGRAPGS